MPQDSEEQRLSFPENLLSNKIGGKSFTSGSRICYPYLLLYLLRDNVVTGAK